jgi:hypothetical protein
MVEGKVKECGIVIRNSNRLHRKTAFSSEFIKSIRFRGKYPVIRKEFYESDYILPVHFRQAFFLWIFVYYCEEKRAVLQL